MRLISTAGLGALMTLILALTPVRVAQPDDAVVQDESGRKVLYWVAPMDPAFRRDAPGKSPMGMDLVPVYADEVGPEVKISSAVVQNMGIRTAEVKKDTLWRRIDTVGYVQPDENLITHLSLRTEGWVEKLAVRAEGERVKKGQLLFELYSPSVVAAQEEYLQALAGGSRRLIRASENRLEVLGMTAGQIRALRENKKVQKRIRVYAPQDGIVQALRVREGMFIKPSDMAVDLVDLSSIWVLAEVFENQVGWVSVGRPAEMRLSYFPGRLWEGEVDYVYPTLDPKTRTLRVRLRFDNKDETLKPNMYASVTIYGGPKRGVKVIPAEALIRTGAEERVIVQTGAGTFAARTVQAGIQVDNEVEILEGLEVGETVVTSGQFLIDSEASLNASMQRMDDGGAAPEEDAATAEGPVEVNGTVRAVMAEHGMLTIEHDPVESLGWPTMTMDFKVVEDVDLSSLESGDAITFSMRKREDAWRIESIEDVGGDVDAAVVGSGVVRALMPGERKVKLAHEPIDRLGWPAMTMDFALTDEVDLSAVKKGDRVRFEMREQDGRYRISSWSVDKADEEQAP